MKSPTINNKSLLLLSLVLALSMSSWAQNSTGRLAGPPTPKETPLLHLSIHLGSVRNHQMSISRDGGVHWHSPQDLPLRVLPARLAGTPLPVTAVAVSAGPRDPGDSDTSWSGSNWILTAVGNRLFASTDQARSWTEIDLADVTNQSSYITAVAVDPDDPGHWLIGTSYDGVYRTTDAGQSWRDLTASGGTRPLRLGAGFYEEVESIRFAADGAAILTLGFGAGLVAVDPETAVGVRLGPALDGPTSYHRLSQTTSLGATMVPGSTISLATGQFLPDTTGWGTLMSERASAGSGADGEAFQSESASAGTDTSQPGDNAGTNPTGPRKIAADQTGIYVSAANASAEKLPGYFEYMREKGFTSMVVDLKDDLGRVTYQSELALPRQVGAVEPWVDLPALVEMAEQNGVHLIGRIVVFKDPRLWAYDGFRLAIWDGRRDRPWGVFRTYTDEETGEQRRVQVEHWVDPYSPEVWEYNISVAREVIDLGVDEIQFDYIRFPSDGNTEDVVTRFEIEGADRVQALEGFLSAAREEIQAPIGIDVFGFNAWSSMNYLGQDITRLAQYVDVISPMFYPSHFARPFLPQFSYLERAEVIYDLGTRRNQALAGPRVLIRPYIQAFLIGDELDFDDPTYLRYLQVQLRGAERAGSSGYTLWNASGRYYMLP